MDFIGCFSEENPTTHLWKYFPVVLLKGYGADYQDGLSGLESSIKLTVDGVRGPYTWMIPFLDEKTKNQLGVV